MSGRLFYWVANWNLSRASAARLLGGNVEDMADATHDAVAAVRGSSLRKVAGYVTGTPDIAWTLSDWDQFSPSIYSVIRIDQAASEDPVSAHVKRASVTDTEPGAADPATAAKVAAFFIHHGEDYTIYVDQGELGAVEEACNALGLPHGEIVAYQWASPTSNPNTILPGTSRTLKEANVDLSVTLPSWHPIPGHTPAPPPKPPAPHTTDRVRAQLDLAVDPETGHWRVERETLIPLPHGRV